MNNEPEARKFPLLIPNGLLQSILVVLLIVAAYYIGTLKTKVEFLEKGSQAANVNQPAVAGAAAPQQPAAATITIDKIKEVFKQNVIRFGDSDRKVLFVAVEDPSCPYCHIATGKNGELNKQVGDRFTLVSDGGTYVAPVPEMKNLLDQGKASFAYIYTPGHGNGEMGTKAMYCAFEKGKFWEVHDLLMTNKGYDLLNNSIKNDKTKSQELADFLSSVFDASEMKSCLDSGKYDSHLTEDVKLATSLGVSGTPGFFVNTTSFNGAYSYKDMESAVNAALGK